MKKPKIILASASIGRKQLLEKLGVSFEIVVSNIDEDKIIHLDPYQMLSFRASAKADDVASKVSKQYLSNIQYKHKYVAKKSNNHPQIADCYLIIAADSMAILNGKTYGKAKNKIDAKRIVSELMGRTHSFVTATSIIHLKLFNSFKILNRWNDVTTTKVTFRSLSPNSLSLYVSRYDLSRFAAGYALNETPWDLVSKIDGSYTNVVGLPFEVILPIFTKLKLI